MVRWIKLIAQLCHGSDTQKTANIFGAWAKHTFRISEAFKTTEGEKTRRLTVSEKWKNKVWKKCGQEKII